MKIIDYAIVNSGTLEFLQKSVLEHIKTGWQPYGSLVKGFDHGPFVFLQPMVKYEQPANQPATIERPVS